MTPIHSQDVFSPEVVTNWCAEESRRVAALLPGLQSPVAEIRTNALYAYGAAFGQIGIDSEEALLAAAGLIKDSEPEIRRVARQTLIDVNRYRPAAPTLPILTQALRDCQDAREAEDLGRVIGCILGYDKYAGSSITTLTSLFKDDTDVIRIGAARAARVVITRERWRLEGIAERLGIYPRDEAETHEGAEILAEIKNRAAASSALLSSDMDPGKLTADWEAVLEIRPLLAERVCCSDPEARREVSQALTSFKADCAEVFPDLLNLFRDKDPDVRAGAFEAMSCCPRELNKIGDMLILMMLKENDVLPMAALVKCVERQLHPSREALAILRRLSGLLPNEVEIEEQHPGVIAIGNGFLMEQAEKALVTIHKRISAN